MSAWESLGKSDDWYTPKYIFDAMGVTFNLDVAGPAVRTHVPCYQTFTYDSLEKPWIGFVWMNPPFGGRNALEPWLDKFFSHGNGVALVPDRTSAPWFQRAAKRCDAVLFLSPKVKFERPDKSLGESPSTGTALMAIGARGVQALMNARSLGWLVREFSCP
jgi:hypothetical protein